MFIYIYLDKGMTLKKKQYWMTCSSSIVESLRTNNIEPECVTQQICVEEQ